MLQALRLLWTLAGTIYGQISGMLDAERAYEGIVPLTKKALQGGTNFNDPDIQRAILEIEKLPPFGARRNNFRKEYLKNKSDFLSLPDDPRHLDNGVWW
ncbi:hypothetical protein [Celerinatantimonas yamalensis]|uniref:Uncharacterized protein n=1 Tax=Celerinatantimonas yamalensis TaxID=559956 RepID=A0ABW9G5Y0_9GAMM